MLKISLIVVFILFNGCSSSVFEIKNQYSLPPETEQTKKCLNVCTLTRDNCIHKYNESFKQCQELKTKEVKRLAKEEETYFNIKNEKYQKSLKHYVIHTRQWEKDYYNITDVLEKTTKECFDKNYFSCEKKIELEKRLETMKTYKPIKPKAIEKENFQPLLNEKLKECNHDCGCETEYNPCFINCGGKIEFEKICVENCD